MLLWLSLCFSGVYTSNHDYDIAIRWNKLFGSCDDHAAHVHIEHKIAGVYFNSFIVYIISDLLTNTSYQNLDKVQMPV